MTDAMRVLGRRRTRAFTTARFPSSRRSTGCASAPVSGSRSPPTSRGAPTGPASRAIFAKRGLSLDFGTSWLLRQRIGVHKAKELAFTAKMLSGDGGVRARVSSTRSCPRPSSTTPSTRSSRRSRPVHRSRSHRRSASSTTRRRSSLAQALEIEALAQSVNVAHRRHARGADRVRWNAARRSSRAGSDAWPDDDPTSWDEVLEDLQRRRAASRGDGRRRAAAQAPRRGQARRPRPHRPPARPRFVPGARHARRRRGSARRRGRDGFGPHRRPAGDGRGRGLHGEGRHDQRGRELQALPRRRDRGRPTACR